ncbi:MAG: nucleotide exchange factor GrpE [Castellaniella sp.]
MSGSPEHDPSQPPADGPSELPQDNEPETIGAGTGEDWTTLLAQSQEQVAAYHDELLRARAEVENVRRRAQEDVARARKFGIEAFAESLVPVKDSLEAALDQAGQDVTAWHEGVQATLRQLVNAFERNALKEVAPEPGERFDPHLHQAIATIPSDQPEGCIAQRLQKGYTIADRVLRPAMVMVSSGAAGASPAQA